MTVKITLTALTWIVPVLMYEITENSFSILTNSAYTKDFNTDANVYLRCTNLSSYGIDTTSQWNLVFEVMSCGDSFILLTPNADLTGASLFEIDIGCWNNDFICTNTRPGQTTYGTGPIVHCFMYRFFWLKWTVNGDVSFGSGDTVDVNTLFTRSTGRIVGGIGIRSGFGHATLWRYTRTVCSGGTYGTSCNLNCGNCLNVVCERDDGACPAGCQPGWTGIMCLEAITTTTATTIETTPTSVDITTTTADKPTTTDSLTTHAITTEDIDTTATTTYALTTHDITTEDIDTTAKTTDGLTTHAITTEDIVTTAKTTDGLTTHAITTEDIYTTAKTRQPSPTMFPMIQSTNSLLESSVQNTNYPENAQDETTITTEIPSRISDESTPNTLTTSTMCCPCSYPDVPVPSTNQNTDTESVVYKVDKLSLSSYKRKHTSASDPRKSSMYIGACGVAIISSCILFIVALDFLPDFRK